MLPFWKIRREVSRLGLQAAQLPWFALSTPLRNRYDRRRPDAVRVDVGDLPLTGDVGLVLIYQPTGLARSLFETLSHLRAHGLSPVVVSNAPIAATDLSELRSASSLVIQRPNFGYDFGGYREGIMTLDDRGVTLDRLVILNDSVWFPIRPDCGFLRNALDSPADLYGLFYNRRHSQPHRSHLQSYFYRFGPRVVRSPAFRDYWRGLFLTNNKWQVVRQNEMKLTDWFERAGHSVEFRYDGADVLAALDALPDDRMREVLEYYVGLDVLAPRPQGDAHRIAPLTPRERERLAGYLLNGHPHVVLDRLDVPMLKKDRQPMYVRQRREIVRHGYHHGMAVAARREIEAAAVAPGAPR